MLKQNRFFIYDNQSDNKIKEIIKRILSEVLAIKYKITLNMIKARLTEKKYNVSICAIFKNEGPYLKEWLEFNHLVGIEHFYMYNNNSQDNYLEVLAPYIDKGWVTLVEWPHEQKQMESYMDCIEKYSSETKWIGFIDIDEFIVPKLTDNIYEFLKPFEKNRGAVNIYWRLYGTSGFVNRDLSHLVVEDFTVCWSKYCDIGKCFYNTAFGFDRESKYSKNLHHKFWANCNGKSVPPVNIFDKVCVGNRNVALNSDFPIQINHYFTKSYKEYEMKCAKGDVYFKINPHNESYFYDHEMKCGSVDYSAYKYINKLKLKMGIDD